MIDVNDYSLNDSGKPAQRRGSLRLPTQRERLKLRPVSPGGPNLTGAATLLRSGLGPSHKQAMRHVVTAAVLAVALAGCSEHETPDPKALKDLSRDVGFAMCSDDMMTAASSLSDIAGASEELGYDPSQSVYDEATDIAEQGCPKWATAADPAVEAVQKVVNSPQGKAALAEVTAASVK